jgi:mannose-6-phosphate isomerase-like protein (cupin superfamily)
MVTQPTILDDGRVRLAFLRTGAETGGEVHEMHASYAPASPLPPAHLHPSQDERFEVLEGELLFIVDGVQRRVRTGEVIDIPRGTVHQARNERDQPAAAIWQTRPALRTAEFFQAIARARDSGDLSELIEAVTEFRDCFVLAEQPAV